MPLLNFMSVVGNVGISLGSVESEAGSSMGRSAECAQVCFFLLFPSLSPPGDSC